MDLHIFSINIRLTLKFKIKTNQSSLVWIKIRSNKKALYVYNKILEDYIDDNNNVSVVMATGLSQILMIETKFYYRLKNHKNFLENLILSFILLVN